MATFTDDGAEHTDLASCQDELDHLRTALRTRPEMDQAKGILMVRHGCSPDEAFDMLSRASQRENRKVRELAESIVTGVQGEPGQETKAG
jgi:AmiR/NasT family two-component response regulator